MEASQYISLLTMMLYEVSPSDLLLTDNMLEVLFPYTYFTVIVIQPESGGIDISSCEGLLNQYYDKCHCYFVEDRCQLICICNHATFFIKPSSFQDKLYQGIGKPFWLGVSISSNSITKLHHLYANACQRIFYKKVFGNNEQLSTTAFFSYQDCIRIFLETDEAKMRDDLLALVQRLCLIDHPAQCYLEQVYVSFFQNITLYLENSGLSGRIEGFRQIPAELHNIPDLIQAIVTQTRNFHNYFKDNTEKGSEILVNQLLRFIREHYKEDISLEDLSCAVGLHPNYVCSFFKKATGQSYLTCLHKERIAAAKQLLADTGYNIDEIAHLVGYNSSTQFARIFRKYENQSPSDYRNQ